ncbi:maker445 [Drosophila busckii]|uniref:Maker445 n=1 Tax=Drosophila busckii TaxID=30019 RepID=A0A0M4E0Y7_DROBS|nr:maker445 [Drosophila busckii]
MQSVNTIAILLATLIAVGLQGSTALTCTDGTASNPCTTSCFTSIDDKGVVSRGCVAENASCAAPSCISCTTDNCNAPLVCKSCDGLGCTLVTAATNNKICDAGQECYNQLQPDGTITRGCGPKCATDSCSSCTTDNCNAGIYPANRLLCYQCTARESCNVPGNATMLKPCALFKEQDQQCYMAGNSYQNMTRGCSTDAAALCPQGSSDSSCCFCSDQNGCNYNQYSSYLGRCIKCSGENCIDKQLATAGADCARYNYTVNEVSCYTQLEANGTVTRGCSNERQTSCAETANCKSCTGSNCNVDEISLSCITCRSDNNAHCRQGDHIGGTACVNPPAAGQASECFEGQWNGIVIRGCLSDAGSLMQSQCKNTADNRCKTCAAIDCNTSSYNGASSLQLSFGLFALLLIALQQCL